MNLFAGIDWATDHHDIVVRNATGERVTSFQVEHSYYGLKLLCDKLLKLAGHDFTKIGCMVETSHGLLVNTLLTAGFSVYPVNPKEIDSRRKASGAKADQIDANIMSKMLYAEWRELKKLCPNSDIIAELQQLTRDQNRLIQTQTALTNQLNACLDDYFPVAKILFTELTSNISLAFLKEHPTLEVARQKDLNQLITFLKEHKHPTSEKAAVEIYKKLHQPQLEARPPIVRAKSRLALVLIEQIYLIQEQIEDYDKEIKQVFKTHSDSFIFTSLNRAGDRLAPRLLAEWGDNRELFQSAKEVQALAGTSPTPYQSGKLSRPHFRWSCVKDFRYVMQSYAWQSTFCETWAAEYYQTKRREGKTHHQALRSLANIWVRIIYAMWKNRLPYMQEVFLSAQSVHKNKIA